MSRDMREFSKKSKSKSERLSSKYQLSRLPNGFICDPNLDAKDHKYSYITANDTVIGYFTYDPDVIKFIKNETKTKELCIDNTFDRDFNYLVTVLAAFNSPKFYRLPVVKELLQSLQTVALDIRPATECKKSQYQHLKAEFFNNYHFEVKASPICSAKLKIGEVPSKNFMTTVSEKINQLSKLSSQEVCNQDVLNLEVDELLDKIKCAKDEGLSIRDNCRLIHELEGLKFKNHPYNKLKLSNFVAPIKEENRHRIERTIKKSPIEMDQDENIIKIHELLCNLKKKIFQEDLTIMQRTRILPILDQLIGKSKNYNLKRYVDALLSKLLWEYYVLSESKDVFDRNESAVIADAITSIDSAVFGSFKEITQTSSIFFLSEANTKAKTEAARKAINKSLEKIDLNRGPIKPLTYSAINTSLQELERKIWNVDNDRNQHRLCDGNQSPRIHLILEILHPEPPPCYLLVNAIIAFCENVSSLLTVTKMKASRTMQTLFCKKTIAVPQIPEVYEQTNNVAQAVNSVKWI